MAPGSTGGSILKRLWKRERVSDGLGRIQPSQRKAVLSFLRQDVARNAYLLSQIARGAIHDDEIAGPLIAHWTEGELDALCIIGSNLVLSSPASNAAIEAFAAYTRSGGFPIWVVVGEDAAVDLFMGFYERSHREIKVERCKQILYQITPEYLDEEARNPQLRAAIVRQTEAIMALDCDMVLEELGYDPFSKDREGYRRGWLRRIREGRTGVLVDEAGRIIFKVDQSAVSRDVIQLAGIYTVPDRRREGIAFGTLGELCAQLFEHVSLVTLYVDGNNAGAIALYESLGFQRVGFVRSVWFED